LAPREGTAAASSAKNPLDEPARLGQLGDIAAGILLHLIPGAIVVPSMVAALAVLQYRYRYAYLTPL
jgi:hypothetical protein